MYLVRDIMYCHPGKARPMVDKFKALSKVLSKMGVGTMRISTDFSAEHYWTVVAEMEVSSIEQHLEPEREARFHFGVSAEKLDPRVDARIVDVRQIPA